MYLTALSACSSSKVATMALIQASVTDGVGVVALDNYAHRNALSAELIAEAIEALAGMRASAQVAILRSVARHPVWSAGHDLHELSPKGWDPLAWHDPLEQFVRAIGAFPGPVIAMIDGSVWGGACDVVFDCDIAMGDETASFMFVPAKLPSAAGAWRNMPAVRTANTEGGWRNHDVLWALSPPVTSKVAPETMRAASEARNTTTGATSLGSIQGTPSGVLAVRIFRASCSSAVDPAGDLPASCNTCA
jgi:hypothetical protein